MMRVRWRMIVEQSRQATLAICALLVGLFSFPLLAGCGGDGKSDKKAGGERKVEKKGGEEAAPATGLKQYSLAELPKLDEPLAPRDQNRLEISPPKGWTILNRDPANPSQIARFCEKDPNDLPRLTIIAEDSPLPDLAEMTEKNAATVCQELQKLAAKKTPNRKIEEDCRPLILGDQIWARHVRRATFSNEPSAIQSLQLIRGGRLYTVELTVPIAGKSEDDLKAGVMKYRKIGYAVAARIKFLKDGKPDSGNAKPSAAVEAAQPSSEKKANTSK